MEVWGLNILSLSVPINFESNWVELDCWTGVSIHCPVLMYQNLQQIQTLWNFAQNGNRFFTSDL